MGSSSQFGGGYTNGFCTGQQIRLVIGEKTEQRGEHGGVFQAGSQFAWIETGESEQSLCSVLVLQDPSERLQGDDIGILPEIGICFHCRFRLMGRQQV